MASVITPGPVPKEVLAFFRAKKLKVGFDYRDVWREEHALNFTVAKAMQLDILESIQEAIGQAQEQGLTLRDFAKDLTPTLQRLGWWGVKEMTDPATGEIIDAQLGSPRRLRTIYTANMRTARAAGQWERAQRTKKVLPYLLRTLGPSRKHRPEHVALAGTLLPVDDSFWDTHFAPDGWGCKCRVRQVTQTEYDRLQADGVPAGGGVGTVPARTTAPKIEYREWRNKRTGKVERVAVGCDPGWDTNPGKTRAADLAAMLEDKRRNTTVSGASQGA